MFMKFYKFASLFFILLITVASVAALAASGYRAEINEDHEPLENPSMVQDESARALAALAILYAPNDDKDRWVKFVCNGMTDGGCEFFKNNHADAIWESPAGHDGVSSGGSLAEVITINDSAQVWHVQMTIFSNSEEIKSDVFVLVERGANGNWVLNRVLYGPWISQEEF